MWACAQRDGRPGNIGGGRPLLKMTSKSSVIPFHVPRRKVWLTPTAQVPCSNAANIGEPNSWMQSIFCTWKIPSQCKTPKVYIQCTSPGDSQTSCKVWLTSIE